MYTPASKALKTLFENDGISEGELARRTNINQPTIHRILTGQSKEPKSSNLSKLAKYYGVEKAVFDTGIIHSQTKEPVSEYANTYIFEQLAATLSMGDGIPAELNHDEQIRTIELDKKWVHARLSCATSMQNIKIITGNGDSMKGTYSHGDALFADVGINTIESDAIYAMLFNDRLFIKRVQRQPDGTLLLISDNNEKYPPIAVDPSDHDNFRVLARIVGIMNYQDES